MSNTIVKISRRAKQIRKAHPSIKWQSAIKQASREIKAGKVSGTHKRKVGRVKKSSRKKVISKLKRAHAAEGKQLNKLGSVSQHMSHARAMLKEQIGWNEAAKFTAPKKSSKNKIQKKINALKAKYRKLC